jgi:hypothetical protein
LNKQLALNVTAADASKPVTSNQRRVDPPAIDDSLADNRLYSGSATVSQTTQ